MASVAVSFVVVVVVVVVVVSGAGQPVQKVIRMTILCVECLISMYKKLQE